MTEEFNEVAGTIKMFFDIFYSNVFDKIEHDTKNGNLIFVYNANILKISHYHVNEPWNFIFNGKQINKNKYSLFKDLKCYYSFKFSSYEEAIKDIFGVFAGENKIIKCSKKYDKKPDFFSDLIRLLEEPSLFYISNECFFELFSDVLEDVLLPENGQNHQKINNKEEFKNITNAIIKVFDFLFETDCYWPEYYDVICNDDNIVFYGLEHDKDALSIIYYNEDKPWNVKYFDIDMETSFENHGKTIKLLIDIFNNEYKFVEYYRDSELIKKEAVKIEPIIDIIKRIYIYNELNNVNKITISKWNDKKAINIYKNKKTNEWDREEDVRE